MSETFKVAIVGSGPGGLSAATRAAEHKISHVLLESSPQISNTIYLYQKGKFVMAEPGVLPLRSPIPFEAGTREAVLDAWNQGVESLGVNVRCNSEVTAIQGQRGDFTLKLKDGGTVNTEAVVLAIGLQGNLRTLGVEGENLPGVQYQLDDPDEYVGETIMVVGAGDAAIENALGLADHNTVIILNRGDEFNRAKEGNLNAILKAIEGKEIECYYKTNVARVEQQDGGKPLRVTLNTSFGETTVEVDRIIARLGAIPPRRFVESCGIVFPNADPTSVPAVSGQYESNVPGLYIIGALAGYPLIKQCMNQGYEVIEYILGNAVEPADEPLLRKKFAPIPNVSTVDEALALIHRHVPLLGGLTTLQVREFMLDSEIRAPQPGDVIYKRNDYTNTFYSIVTGDVHVHPEPDDPTQFVTLRSGQFFGEMSLISGRRRNATTVAGKDCVLIETPRRSMNKLISSVESVKRIIDETFLLRAIQSGVAPNVPAEQLASVVQTATIEHFGADEVLFEEGEEGDCLHMIRKGSVTVSRKIGDHDIVLAYVPAGNYVGEMAILTSAPRSATVRAAVATETIRLEGQAFMALLSRAPDLRQEIEATFQTRVQQNLEMETRPQSGNIISFLMEHGIGEATDVLLIDESLCVRCDNCEKACADTHGHISRLNREAGPTYASVHVPTSCRHCEHPHCMKDCPPDAIHRAPNGEVYIADNCIGCGNCERNCPYGVIQMGVVDDRKPRLWSWLLFGMGVSPGTDTRSLGKASTDAVKLAVKCDMCKDLPGGPACVRACPTGAAIRVKPEQFMAIASR